jgi:hypothetical protein
MEKDIVDVDHRQELGGRVVDILLGIFLVVLGISVAFIGIQLFVVMLPIVGLVTGFFVGADLAYRVFGDGFLSTVAGWLIGMVVGVVFAAIAWYWWYAGVLITAGAVGAILFSGLAHAIGMDSGLAVALFAIAGAIALGILTLMLDLPVYMVNWNTAVSGAAIAIAGVMLVFNQIDRADLEYGASVAAIEASWFWVLAFVAVAAVGVVRQLALKERVRMPRDRWASAQGSI